MYSKRAVRASVLAGHARRWMRSFLIVAWKLSRTALSKQSPRLPIETSIPTARATLREDQRRVLGGFQRSSQRSIRRSCDGQAEASVGPSGAAGDAITGSAIGRSTRTPAALLGGDRARR